MNGRLVVIIAAFAVDYGEVGAASFPAVSGRFPAPPVQVKPPERRTEVEPGQADAAQVVGALDVGLGQEGQRGDDGGAVAEVLGLDGQHEHEQDRSLRLQQSEDNDQCQQARHHAGTGDAKG